MKLLVKILIGIIAVIVLISCAITALLFNSSFQEFLKNEALNALAKKLQTEVRLDSASLSIHNGSIALYGLEVDDRSGELMLHSDTLYGKVSISELFKKNIDINSIKLFGTKANLYKVKEDTAANYQFVIDTFKKKEKTGSTKVAFNIENIEVENTEVNWQVRSIPNSSINAKLGNATFNISNYSVLFQKLGANNLKNAISVDSICCDSLHYIRVKGINIFPKDKNNKFSIETISLTDLKTIQIKGIHILTDNGKPRKNKVNPNHGAFDPGHMNADFNAQLTIRNLQKNNIIVNIDKISGLDKASGLKIDNMSALISTDTKTAQITNLKLSNNKTTIHIPSISIKGLQGKKNSPFGSSLTFTTSKFHTHAILKDISKPFAPALINFTKPVECTAWASGNINHIDFHNIYTYSPDKRLQIHAKGYIDKLNQPKNTLVHFDILSMKARNGIKDELINQFVYKKSMAGIVKAVGDIGFIGSIDIPFKQFGARGTLNTGIGSAKVNFHINNKTFFVEGDASTDSINLGKLIGNPNIGNLTFEASFKFDIAGSHAAKILKRKLTPLPSGWIKGEAKEAHYRKLTLHDTYFNINSNGYNASGEVRMVRAFADYLCTFSFADTNFPGSLHFKPSIKFHKLSKESAERRQKRKEEKAKIKAEKKAEKDKIKAEKEAIKAAKAEAKAKAKAEKKAAKAAKQKANE